MSQVTKSERKSRTDVALLVFCGYLSPSEGARELHTKPSAFATWITRNNIYHKLENQIEAAPGSIKCEFCKRHFKTRLSLGAHLAQAHHGKHLGTCGLCDIVLTIDNIALNRKDRVCADCIQTRDRIYRETVKPTAKSGYHSEYRKRQRELVLSHYGNACICCGENKYEFLTIDHINGGGSEHKRQIKTSLYGWLIRSKYPSGFQVLCYNCNSAKGVYGECPHKTIYAK